MALKLSSEDRKEGQQLLRQSKKQKKLQFFAAVEACLQFVLAWVFQLLLSFFVDLQDAFLAIRIVRKLVAFALAPRCLASVVSRLRFADKHLDSFEKLRYSVSEQARELLVHAGLHAFITPQAAASELPKIGRILLQTGTENSGKFQEAVAGALAHELKASLLVIDDPLLAQLAQDALGSPGNGSEGNSSSIWAYVLSFWLSGGKVAFVWSVLHRICMRIEHPLVILVRDIENVVCQSMDSFEAFVDAFGSLSQAPSPTIQLFQPTKGQSVVLLGGSSLADKKPEAPLSSLRNLLERSGTEGGRPGLTGSADDAFSLLPDLNLMMQEEQPSPHDLLEKLFMTRVKLEAPASGPSAQQHMQQMAQDAADLVAEQNLKELSSFGLQRSLLPPASSALLRKRKLSNNEWAKVVTWAKSMEAIMKTRETLELVAKLQSAEEGEPQVEAAGPSSAPTPNVRRSASAISSAGFSLEDIANKARQLQELKRQQGKSADASKAQTSPTDAGVGLSERALWYGIRMLERGDPGGKHAVKTDNAYERRLLNEVIRPEDAGSGFADVGALRDVKDALREVVQLPLQHPDLFVSGSLARLSKGVLLFGPPGTGKTMLARAVAAECGASFLAIHPSAVASKWLGDGVRFVRAAFSLAAKLAPCVIFLDEVDALLSRRNSHHEHEALREMKNEAMAQWDGIRLSGNSPSDRVIVLGATNRPQDLDEAVLRRFSRRIFCDAPNRKSRVEILEVMLAGENLADDVELAKVADRTEGYSGSDLREVCTAAAMRPLRDLLKTTGKSAQIKEAKLLQSSQTDKSSTALLGQETATQQQKEASRDLTCNEQSGQPNLVGTTSTGGNETASDATSELQRTETQLSLSTQALVAGKRRTEIMEVLLDDCNRMAASADSMSHKKLRPISMEDFEEAVKRTAPSMDEHSHTMDELRTWNSKYGEGSRNSSYHNPKLSYFI